MSKRYSIIEMEAGAFIEDTARSEARPAGGAITFNHLNLPMKITFNSGSYIEYIYDATGKKVSKTVYDSSNTSTTTTEYLDGFQYKNTIMELFATKEGYVTVTNRALPESTPSYRHSYAFNYIDHLGNVRLTFGLNGAKVRILAENNYYPFGLKHKNYNVTQQQYQESNGEIDLVTCTSCDYKYKYNGKEWQDELGLNFYDYGARNYDPAIGRWMNIDPLAEKSRRFSPYVYALNNPVYFIDPDGMEASSFESNDIINLDVNSGQISVTAAPGNDVVQAMDNGVVVDSYEYGDNGSFQRDTTIEQNQEVGNWKNAQIVSSSNSEKMEELFLFAAKNSKAEFGLVDAMKEGIAKSSLITVGHETKVPTSHLAKMMYYDDFEICTVNHSHPAAGEPQPSGFFPNGTIDHNYDGDNDRSNAAGLLRLQNDMIFRVYSISTNKVFQYNGQNMTSSPLNK